MSSTEAAGAGTSAAAVEAQFEGSRPSTSIELPAGAVGVAVGAPAVKLTPHFGHLIRFPIA